MQSKIMLCFYTPTPQDVWVNRAVAVVGRHRFCHCELRFDDGFATSIFAGEQVFYRKRTYSNPNYTLLSMLVSARQERALKAIAEEHAQGNVTFDACGMYAAVSPCMAGVYAVLCGCVCCDRGSARLKPTFCSSYVTHLLQRVGIQEVALLNPRSTTPSMLYDAVHRTPMVCWDTVPFKMTMISDPLRV